MGTEGVYNGGHGGGAVQIAAGGGAVTVNGTITANGQAAPDWNAGGGSGGGIYITCRTLAGTGGVVQANAEMLSGLVLHQLRRNGAPIRGRQTNHSGTRSSPISSSNEPHGRTTHQLSPLTRTSGTKSRVL